MDASVSGRNADTVYRDKSGKRYTSKAEYMEAMEEQKKEKANKHVTEEELEWGGGMKQKKKKQAALEAMKKEVRIARRCRSSPRRVFTLMAMHRGRRCRMECSWAFVA